VVGASVGVAEEERLFPAARDAETLLDAVREGDARSETLPKEEAEATLGVGEPVPFLPGEGVGGGDAEALAVLLAEAAAEVEAAREALGEPLCVLEGSVLRLNEELPVNEPLSGADLEAEPLPDVELEAPGEAVMEGDRGAEEVPLKGAEAVLVTAAVSDSVAVALRVENAVEDTLRVAFAEREMVEEPLRVFASGEAVEAFVGRLLRLTEGVPVSMALSMEVTVCVGVAKLVAAVEGDTSKLSVGGAVSVAAGVMLCVPVSSKRCVMLMIADCETEGVEDSRAEADAESEGKEAETEGDTEGVRETRVDVESLADSEGDDEVEGDGEREAEPVTLSETPKEREGVVEGE
jgi:hypothetical protein